MIIIAVAVLKNEIAQARQKGLKATALSHFNDHTRPSGSKIKAIHI
jgi:hypothetical protein